MKQEIIFRKATTVDIPFLVDTIIEAEKSGTDILSYTTVFGLTEEETRKYISDMLMEEVDGCELSVSSFLLAEVDGKIAAAAAAWIEGIEGIPSAMLKGNLLNYILPQECIRRALEKKKLLDELHIECYPNTMQLGLVYVSEKFRGMNLAQRLIDEQVSILTKIRPEINAMYVQVFGNNQAAIKAYEKVDFNVAMVKEAESKEEIIKYLPYEKKILMKKNLSEQK